MFRVTEGSLKHRENAGQLMHLAVVNRMLRKTNLISQQVEKMQADFEHRVGVFVGGVQSCRESNRVKAECG